MKKIWLHVIVVLASLVFFSQCAKKGNPSGGPKDSIPPIIVKSNPENYSSNFTGDEIRIYFDEFIKLKDLQQNLVVSPPLKYQPVITPITSAKVLKIKILDTLRDNTTYVFNFGKSIVDNNEENEFDYFKYVFSTGDYIDSLKVEGKVSDALKPQLEGKATVMLYEASEEFNDSIVFQEKPYYITTTKDNDPSFELTNLKEGNYVMIALQEESNNYIFEPKKDKIGFIQEFITVPVDSAASFQLTLFEETPNYRLTRPSHVSKHKIAFGFEGEIDSLTIEPMFELPEGYVSKTLRDPKKDSLNYWFKPAFDMEVTDTLTFLAKNIGLIDTLEVRLRDLYADSLQVSLKGGGTLTPKDTVRFQSNTPLVKADVEKLTIMDQDSLFLEKQLVLDEKNNEALLLFDKKDENTYQIKALPEAFTDFFENTTDTLEYTLRTKPASDYGTIDFTLSGIESFPVIVELVNEKFQVVTSEYLEENKAVSFTYLVPNKYYLRIIYDANGNKQWDTGNFLLKTQPEKVVYYPSQIEVRSNWSLNENFILE